MRLLVLDDDEERLVRFKKRYGHHDLVGVATSTRAKEEIEKERFDMIFLDHDLGEFIEKNGEKKEITGADVAKVIAALPEDKRPERVIVHSMNEAGASSIKAILAEAGVPVLRTIFSTLMNK